MVSASGGRAAKQGGAPEAGDAAAQHQSSSPLIRANWQVPVVSAESNGLENR